MEERDMNEMLFGKEVVAKAKLFDIEMSAINEQHIEFFKDRKSHLDSQEHDSVFNHVATSTSNGMIELYFMDDVLPQHIKDDCLAAFNKVYGDSTSGD